MSTVLVSSNSQVNGRNLRRHDDRLSQRVKAVPPSGIRRYFDIAATMEDVISLGIGEPDFVSPPPILQRGYRQPSTRPDGVHLQCRHDRTARGGGPQPPCALRRTGLRPREEVLITVGVSEAMYLIMQAILDWGDEVIVPQPCFVSYTASVILAGGNGGHPHLRRQRLPGDGRRSRPPSRRAPRRCSSATRATRPARS
ncbi:MAG: hypothetical protein R2838_11235 [Caldilineaceae bacterium]